MLRLASTDTSTASEIKHCSVCRVQNGPSQLQTPAQPETPETAQDSSVSNL